MAGAGRGPPGTLHVERFSPVEVDESSGMQQIQLAVPVLDGGKPIGSLVVGISITKLSQQK